jgi:hypothetical protein
VSSDRSHRSVSLRYPQRWVPSTSDLDKVGGTDMAALAPVIPLLHKENKPTSDFLPTPDPEPLQLYGLAVIALCLHAPITERPHAPCRTCWNVWPCPQVCLACRHLDGL